MATLESHDKNLYGNGQPGRVALLERTVEELKRWRWWVVGAAVGGGGVVGVLAWVVEVVAAITISSRLSCRAFTHGE